MYEVLHIFYFCFFKFSNRSIWYHTNRRTLFSFCVHSIFLSLVVVDASTERYLSMESTKPTTATTIENNNDTGACRHTWSADTMELITLRIFAERGRWKLALSVGLPPRCSSRNSMGGVTTLCARAMTWIDCTCMIDTAGFQHTRAKKTNKRKSWCLKRQCLSVGLPPRYSSL